MTGIEMGHYSAALIVSLSVCRFIASGCCSVLARCCPDEALNAIHLPKIRVESASCLDVKKSIFKISSGRG